MAAVVAMVVGLTMLTLTGATPARSGGTPPPPPPLPHPLYVRWMGSNSSYDDVRVPCCHYSELADVMVSSPRCLRPLAVPADGRCHRDEPTARRLRLTVAWSDGTVQVVHARTGRYVFTEAMPYRVRDVRWTGAAHPQQTIEVHEEWPGHGFVHLGTALRDVRFNAEWPEHAGATTGGRP